MDPNMKKKCKDWLKKGDWRIVEDKTIEHNYKGFETPLICSHKDTYFNPDFYKKLIKKCKGRPARDKGEDVCIQEDNYCSLNEKEECFFDTTRVNEDNIDDRLKIFGVESEINKSKIYSNRILNNKNEINRITEDNQELLEDIDPKNILSGRGENLKVSIVELNCSQLKSGIGDLNDEDIDIFDIDYDFDDLNDTDKDIRRRLENYKYNCEKKIIYPEVNFAKYNKDYNNTNLPKVPKIEEVDDKNIQKEREGLEDIQGLQWHPEIYNTLLTELQKNHIFRKCVDRKLGIKKHDEIMKDFKKKHFTIDKWKKAHINYIKDKIHKFESLTQSDIRECLNKLSFSNKLKNDICTGDITINMLEGFMIVLLFFDIHIDKKHINTNNGKKNLDLLILEITPLVKNILRKIIDISETIESDVCPHNRVSYITDSLKKIYNNLFESSKTPITIFKNLDITSDFFKDFTTNIYVKIILLVFVAFIFAKIVDLFSGKDCSQIPVNTK